MADVVPLRGRTDPDPSSRADRLAEVGAIIRGTGLAGLVRPASQPVDAPSTTNEILPVLPALRPLLPWGGLRRGSTVAVDAAAGHSAPDPDRPPTTPPGPGRGPQSGPTRRPGARADRTRLAAVPPPDNDSGDPAPAPSTDAPDGAVGPTTRPVGGAAADGAGPAGAVGLVAARAVSGPVGAVSMLLALLSAASAGGSWCAVVGLPGLGVAAAAESGISLERLALVPYPGPEWPAVVAALLDGFDLVVTAPPGRVGADVAGRLSARARQRGSVLLAVGAWTGAELVLAPVDSAWEGLGQGRGRLRQRELTVVAHGRGAATRPRYAQLSLPAPAPLLALTATPAPAPGPLTAASDPVSGSGPVSASGPVSGASPVSGSDPVSGSGPARASRPAAGWGDLELDGFELAEAVGACG
jgi:hypothetical protein